MSTPVPDHPSGGRLLPFRTARPVSTAHSLRWASELAYLLAHNVQPVYSGTLLGAIGTHSVAIAYQRSPGVKVLLVTIELLNLASGTATGVFTYTLTGSAELTGSAFNNASLTSPPDNVRSPKAHEIFIDVSAVSSTAPETLLLTWTASASSLYRVHVAEVPLGDLSPTEAPTTEVGISASWCTPDGRLVDSTPDNGFGFPRIFSQLDLARSGMRRHMQIATHEVTAGTYSYSTASTTLVTLTGRFYTRARRLYSSSTPNAYKLWVRYKAVSGGTIRVVTSGSSFDVALPASASFTSTTDDVSLPCSTTDQDVEIYFQGKTANAANPIYVSTLALIENEA